MTHAHLLLLMDVALAAFVGFDLRRTLRTGLARGRGGTITRQKRPEKYWRYVYSSYAMLAACAGLFLWILIAPESL
ncbi:MAG TPA: hypothetical protein VGZ72_09355 [Stellaceae bacterium]|nr:hypothetical protein [Stellaceae bacterium]